MRIPESCEIGLAIPQRRVLVIADIGRAGPGDDVRERVGISVNAIPCVVVEGTHGIHGYVRGLRDLQAVASIAAATERIENYAAGLYVNAFSRGVCDVQPIHIDKV